LNYNILKIFTKNYNSNIRFIKDHCYFIKLNFNGVLIHIYRNKYYCITYYIINRLYFFLLYVNITILQRCEMKSSIFQCFVWLCISGILFQKGHSCKSTKCYLIKSHIVLIISFFWIGRIIFASDHTSPILSIIVVLMIAIYYSKPSREWCYNSRRVKNVESTVGS